MRSFGSWKERVRALKKETFALYLACRHPAVPWYAKGLAVLVVGYALSPIDLISDFIPVLGYVDDVAVVLLTLVVIVRFTPRAVVTDLLEESQRQTPHKEAGKSQ